MAIVILSVEEMKDWERNLKGFRRRTTETLMLLSGHLGGRGVEVLRPDGENLSGEFSFIGNNPRIQIVKEIDVYDDEKLMPVDEQFAGVHGANTSYDDHE